MREPAELAEPSGKQPATQLSFSAVNETDQWPAARSPRIRPVAVAEPPEGVLEFEKRARQAGLSPNTIRRQAQCLSLLLKRAQAMTGGRVSVQQLLTDVKLLASVVSNERDHRWPGRRLSRRTLVSNLSSARSLLRRLEDWLGIEAEAEIGKLEDELADRFPGPGLRRFSMPGAQPPKNRFTPTADDVTRLITYLGGSAKSYVGERDVALVQLLIGTGLRISSAVAICGEDFRRSPDGLTVFVREKCRPAEEERLIDPSVKTALSRYVAAFNGHAAKRNCATRIGFGVPGPFWRCGLDKPWTSVGAQHEIAYASRRACSHQFRPHAFRRFAAQVLAEEWPRDLVADVIGWSSKGVLDRHYAMRPGEARTWLEGGAKIGDLDDRNNTDAA